MIRHARSAGLLAVLLIPAMLIPTVWQIGMPVGGVLVGRAWYASPPLAAMSAALLGAVAVSAVPAAVARALLFWPIAPVAVMAVWLIRLWRGRWSRIAADHREAAVISSESWPDIAPLTLSVAPGIMPTVPDRTPVEGADLAARARFVAMSFAFPDACQSRATTRDGVASWPLQIMCHPTRFTLTLQHAALGYRLEFCNRGAKALGPLMIRAALVTAEQGAQGRTDNLALCHYIDGLAVSDSIEVIGELRLPLAGIAAMRLGSAELLVPMMCVSADSAGDVRTPLSLSARFAIGMPPLAAGGGIQPFRLDTGPGIWRKLTVRRINGADLS